MSQHTKNGKISISPTYSVGDAARLVGVSPATVRLYEREGLLKLGRTPGGHRYLTEADLSTLKRIRTLRRTQGESLDEIRRELEQAELPPTTSSAQGSATNLPGPRLRVLRQRKGLTLREVAAKTGLSPSFLSTFERGLTGISVAHLQKLMSVCGTNMVDLFSEPGQERRKMILPGQRPGLTLNDGAVLIEDLAVGPRQMEIQIWTIQPGAASEGSYSHQGEEAIYLLSGSLEVYLNELECYSLVPGACLYFSSSEAHRWRNPGPESAVLLWVNTPPTF
jgi:DNA-binding transcriptional MerR regulator